MKKAFSLGRIKDSFLLALDRAKLGGIGISYLLTFKKYLLLFIFGWFFFLVRKFFLIFSVFRDFLFYKWRRLYYNISVKNPLAFLP